MILWIHMWFYKLHVIFKIINSQVIFAVKISTEEGKLEKNSSKLYWSIRLLKNEKIISSLQGNFFILWRFTVCKIIYFQKYLESEVFFVKKQNIKNCQFDLRKFEIYVWSHLIYTIYKTKIVKMKSEKLRKWNTEKIKMKMLKQLIISNFKIKWNVEKIKKKMLNINYEQFSNLMVDLI